MRLAASLTIGLTFSAMLAAQDTPEQGILLQDQKTGLALTLPADWTFATSPRGMIGTNGDKSAMVLLAGADQPFETLAFNLESDLEERALRDIELDRAVIVLGRNRGALDGLVQADGTGLNQTGERVSFSALVVKEQNAVGVVLGAWKDAAQGLIVKDILEGIHNRQPSGAGGVALTDTESGASIDIPAGWVTIAGKTGLLAYSPDRGGMAVIMREQGDFSAKVQDLRTTLKGRVFDNVEVGDLAAVQVADADAKTELARIMEASGKATDRVDHKPVDFRVMAVRNTGEDRGALVLGAWKSPEYQAQIATMLASIKTARPKTDETRKRQGWKRK